MFSTYKVAFYTTTYRYHVKRQDIGQPIRLLIITSHIQLEFLCAGNGRCNSLRSCGWELVDGTGASHYCAVPCPDLRSVRTRAVALYANNKRTRVTSKLALWFFYHSRTAACSPRCMYKLVFNQFVLRIPCAIDNKKRT